VKPEAYSDVRCFRWVKSHREVILRRATAAGLTAATETGAVQPLASALRINTSPAGYYGDILLGFRRIEEPVEAAGWVGDSSETPCSAPSSRLKTGEHRNLSAQHEDL
jgi:hypothetical protein